MGQYDIADLLLESDTPLSRGDIAKKIGRSGSTVGYGLKQLQKKNYVIKSGSGYELAEEVGEAEVESLKPTPIDEARNQNDQ
jgi:Mn-dependent DtxR family transcriptional regulator